MDIEARARELFNDGDHDCEGIAEFAREAADERAEEIAQAILAQGVKTDPLWSAATVARSTIQKPETREQRLERR